MRRVVLMTGPFLVAFQALPEVEDGLKRSQCYD